MIDLNEVLDGSRPGGIVGVILRALGLLKGGGGMTGEEAGGVKLSYLMGGGDPAKVISPERLGAFHRGGLAALLSTPASTRSDGSIAGGYMPTATALRRGMIEPAAISTVMSAENNGIRTVSSGVDRATGKPYAIGVSPDGQVREVRGRQFKPT